MLGALSAWNGQHIILPSTSSSSIRSTSETSILRHRVIVVIFSVGQVVVGLRAIRKLAGTLVGRARYLQVAPEIPTGS